MHRAALDPPRYPAGPEEVALRIEAAAATQALLPKPKAPDDASMWDLAELRAPDDEASLRAQASTAAVTELEEVLSWLAWLDPVDRYVMNRRLAGDSFARIDEKLRGARRAYDLAFAAGSSFAGWSGQGFARARRVAGAPKRPRGASPARRAFLYACALIAWRLARGETPPGRTPNDAAPAELARRHVAARRARAHRIDET